MSFDPWRERPVFPTNWRMRYRVRCKNTGATATVFSHTAAGTSRFLVKGPDGGFDECFRGARAFKLAQAAVAPRKQVGTL